MKLSVLLAIVLCACATSCSRKDTDTVGTGRRNIEPRLSVSTEWERCWKKPAVAGRVVEETQCGPVRRLEVDCGGTITTYDRAVADIAKGQCLDRAIDALSGRFALLDPKAMSDLSAAYYVRAQQNDRPSDFLDALEAADQAIAKNPRLAEAHFNRALTRQALGLTEEAIASWNEFIELDRSQWADEARRNRDQLEHERKTDDMARWQLNRGPLVAALRTGDRETVARLIAPFPSAAQRLFEEELIVHLATTPTKENFDRVTMFARELSKRLGDPFAVDVVKAIQVASPEQLVALREGHLAYVKGRRAEQSFADDAASDYRQAAEKLSFGGSPFHLRAELGIATLDELDPIGLEADQKGYLHLSARVHWRRGHFQSQVNYLKSLAEYETARLLYARLRDYEGLIAVHTRRSGVLRIVGHHELAWREAFYAKRHTARLVELKDRHALLLETGYAAQVLGHSRAAVLYQNAAVRLFQDELLRTPPEEISRLQGHQTNLGVAYRHRAGTLLSLGNHDRATHDLAESDRLSQTTKTAPDIQRILNARRQEIRGQSLLRSNPQSAVDAFTEAIRDTSPEYRTFHAWLYAQRADANLLAGRGEDAQRDLDRALLVLREEEEAILGQRKPGEGEELWSPYFSRFQETYRRLILQLAESNRHAAAFLYAERARAYEPLDLAQKRGSIPPEVEMLLTQATRVEKDAQTVLSRVQQAIPAGTFIIQYCVLDDRTYVWILSRHSFRQLKLPNVNRAVTERWSRQLQDGIRQRDTTVMDGAFLAAYTSLMAEPLAMIAKMPGGPQMTRLVVVPDAAIHGLPISALRNSVTREYLFQQIPSEIGGSTALYLYSLSRDRELPFPKTPSVLAVGEPKFDRTMTLAQGMSDLPKAKLEAEQVRNLYAPYSEILTGADATVPAFLEKATKHEIVHFAGHTVVNAQEPSHSFLLLAPSPSSKDTGVLEARELLEQLKLGRTRLFILASCRSAGGMPVGPEGVSPFVRPLLAAGVPAVIGSLWDVNDATAEELMVSFHRHYEEGRDAAVAMQAAQLDLLKHETPVYQTVLAWAPFQVIGHASSPFGPRDTNNGETTSGIHSSNSLQRPDRLRPQ